MKDPRRPIGSFIFLGPTGVGRTELARTLAAALFDFEDNMVRLDMSEYQERHTVSRLVGVPPGYVGYEEGGQLTEAVRRKPYSVVLCDEIEKAHADVFNTLLQMLDDGRITDAQGHTEISVTRHHHDLQHRLGAPHCRDGRRGRDRARGARQGHGRPASPLPARVPQPGRRRGAVPGLSLGQIERIVDLQLAQLSQRLAERQLTLEMTGAARRLIAERGYDPVYGARPLRRYLAHVVETKIGRALLAGELPEGSVIRLDVRDADLVVERLEPAGARPGG